MSEGRGGGGGVGEVVSGEEFLDGERKKRQEVHLTADGVAHI
jgi:hypothetical protein